MMINTELIKRKAKEKDLKLYQIAEMLSLKNGSFYNKISCNRSFTLDQLFKITEILNVSINDLVRNDGDSDGK